MSQKDIENVFLVEEDEAIADGLMDDELDSDEEEIRDDLDELEKI